ncbi:MAG: lycopene cyclase domain-containing protein [Minisyncoccia bacterium]
MNMDIGFAYSGYIVFFAIIWIILFWRRPDLRNEILLMSLLAAPLGPVGDFFYRVDYYNLPNLNGELWFLFSAAVGFVYGGVAAVLYEECVRGTHAKTFHHVYAKKHIYWFLLVAIIGSVFVFSTREFLYVNSFHSSLIVMLGGGVGAIYWRHDLLREAIGSGLALMLVSVAYYSMALIIFPNLFQQWNQNVMSGINPLRIPVEEWAWAFAWGFIAGPAYEFSRGFWIRAGKTFIRRGGKSLV